MKDILPRTNTVKEKLRHATDAQRNATLAFDRLLSAVHTIDFWVQKGSDAHKLLMGDIEQAGEEQKNLYLEIVNLIQTKTEEWRR
tara:strand:+ start:936 stop:1190 length:255 start_codon:yes stop_codon:yes gene_type:complete